MPFPPSPWHLPPRPHPIQAQRSALVYGAGWLHTLDEVHDKDSSRRHNSTWAQHVDEKDYLPGDLATELAELRGLELDVPLYRTGRVLARLDSIMWEAVQGADEVAGVVAGGEDGGGEGGPRGGAGGAGGGTAGAPGASGKEADEPRCGYFWQGTHPAPINVRSVRNAHPHP